MNILYISNKSIYPILDGGCFAMSQFLDCLNELNNVKVKHFSLSTKKHPFTISNYPAKIQQLNKPEGLFVKTSFQLKFINSLFSNSKSYIISRFFNLKNAKKIEQYIEQNTIDIVILETPFLSRYIDFIKQKSDAKIFIRTHNVEATIWEEKHFNEPNFLKSILFKKLAKQLKEEENNTLNKCDGIISISNYDTSIFKNKFLKNKIITLPPFITTENEVNEVKASIFFMGAMNWKPNIDAKNRLINSIFPKIQLQNPEIKLHIAGSFSDDLKTINQKNINFHGFVDDKVNFMKNSGILVVPLTSGSGIKIKILEAMSYGIPVIGTKKAFEGINITNNKEVIIAETDEEFAEEVILLINDANKRNEIGKNGKHFIQKNYKKTDICEQLDEFIKRK